MSLHAGSSLFGAAAVAAFALLTSAAAEAADPWNGTYAGLSVGYGFGGKGDQTGNLVVPPPATANHTSQWSGSDQLSGALAGGQLGYNWRAAPSIVIGVETDIQGIGLDSRSRIIGAMPTPNNAPNTQHAEIEASANVEWFGTLRGRLGYVLPASGLMLFATGGLAYGKVDNTVVATAVNSNGSTLSGSGSFGEMKLGWTAGAGVEWSPADRWSIKAEYLYRLSAISRG